MGDGDGQADVAHPFAANLLLGHLHTAAVADDAAVADPLVLSAVALVVLRRAEEGKKEPAGGSGVSTFFSTGSDETLQKLVRQIAGDDADRYLYHSLYII